MNDKAGRNQVGVIFNIQKYSVHDGPGIRTVVFMKGCPMRCLWCCNPESQRRGPELVFNANKCLTTAKCGMCLNTCLTKALRETPDNLIEILRRDCDSCFECADRCPSRALNVFGEEMHVNRILQVVEEDGIFYSRTRGGLTLSGGEPMFIPRFALSILREARRRRLDTSMETCGYCRFEYLEQACRLLQTLFFDIKSMNDERHRRFTGVSNRRILENFIRVCDEFPKLPKLVRTPVVPGFNDAEEDIRAVIDFISDKANVTYELLTYHRLGKAKYEYLGREYLMPETDHEVRQETMKKLRALVAESKLNP